MRVKLRFEFSRLCTEAIVVNPQAKARRRAADAASISAGELPEGKRARNKREKRDRIVTAAHRLFRKHGYSETTTQQIAEAADIGSGTLFLYAKSKEDLLILVFTTEMHALIERAFKGIDVDADLLDQVLALFQRFIAYHARDVALAHQLIREITFLRHPERATELRAITRAIIDKLVLLLERAFAQHALSSDANLTLLANRLFSISYQQLQTWLSGYVSRRRFERTLENMLRYLILQSRRDA